MNEYTKHTRSPFWKISPKREDCMDYGSCLQVYLKNFVENEWMKSQVGVCWFNFIIAITAILSW